MAAVSRLGDVSTGHGCFPPTTCTGANSSKTYINGILVQVLGSSYAPHTCGPDTHSGIVSSSGSSNTFIEGFAAVRIGDALNCGDAVATGSSDTFIGG